MRILFVAPYVPSRVRVRPYEFIRTLSALGHSVHVVALQPPEDRWASDAALRASADQVEVFVLARARTLVNTARALAGRQPLQAAYSHHPEARRRLQALVRGGRFDVLHVEHLRGVRLVRDLAGIPVVFDAVDSIAHLFAQTARSAPRLPQRLLARLDLRRTQRFEARAPFLFQRTLVTSAADREAFERLAGTRAHGRVTVVPNGVDWRYFEQPTRCPDAATVLFSGKMSYHANAAAALHLARDVMPRVWEQRRDARLLIAGKDPPPQVRALAADPRIEVTGYLEDLRPLFRRATVAVAPMVYGAGIQNKVLEAMASGVPIVVSPQACAGLHAEAAVDLIVAAAPDEMAREILRVCDDENLQDRLRAAARAYVRRHHDWAAIGRALADVYDEARREWSRLEGAAASR